MESLEEVMKMDYWDLSPEQVRLVFDSHKELLKRLEIVERVPTWDLVSAWLTHVRPLLEVKDE